MQLEDKIANLINLGIFSQQWYDALEEELMSNSFRDLILSGLVVENHQLGFDLQLKGIVMFPLELPALFGTSLEFIRIQSNNRIKVKFITLLNLKELTLHNIEFDLPKMPSLKILRLKQCHFSIDKTQFDFDNSKLIKLEIIECGLRDISKITLLNNLKSMILNGNNIHRLSEEINQLSQITSLDLRSNNIKSIPTSFYNLSLKKLLIEDNPVQPDINQLNSMPLEVLYLGNSEIPKIHTLKDLRISFVKGGLQDFLFDGSLSLHTLEISGEFTQISDNINTSDLNSLSIRAPILQVPSNFYDLQLEKLTLMSEISSINGIENMSSLKYLDIGDCPLESLPDLSSLINLEYLRVPRNLKDQLSRKIRQMSMNNLRLDLVN